MNTMTNLIGGVADAGTQSMPWTFHATGFAASAKRSADAAIPQRKRRAAAAPVASVKRGTT